MSAPRDARERVSRALQIMRAPSQWVAEHAPVGIFLVDGRGRPIYLNPRACQLLGRPEAQMLGRGWWRALHPDDYRKVARGWRQALTKTSTFQAEYRLRQPDGSTRWVHGKVRCATHGGRKVLVGSLSDISARKQAEQSLKESRNHINTVLDTSPLAILSMSREGRILAWSKGAQRMFGWTESEVLGRLSPIVSRRDRPAFRQMIHQVLGGEVLRGRTFRRLRKDGSTALVTVSAAAALDGDGMPTGVVAILDDITDRAALHGQLQVLLEDREQLLRDLHDNCIQALFAIGLGLEHCESMAGTDPEKTRAQIKNATVNLGLVMRDLRSFLTRRYRQNAGDLDLQHEIERVTQVAGDAGPRFTVRIDKKVADALAPEAAYELLHIAREGISNIVRHSRAHRAAVSLRHYNGRVRLVLDDDGAGLDLQGRHGLGFRGISGRVSELGGRWHIAPRPRRGTRLIVEVPAP
ncbi:MAG TPA: PAS domain S-box protein [Verrucomicrobiae bacterium]|nr:PAS domain S-box protein [Verrucomicrobiae bacterium]